MDTHTNQSTAQRRLTSCTGASMAVRTIIMRTRAALGTLAEATEAAVEVSLKTYIVRLLEVPNIVVIIQQRYSHDSDIVGGVEGDVVHLGDKDGGHRHEE